MSKECILYIENEAYGKRLMQMISQKSQMQFGVRLYTERDGIKRYLEQNKPELLIMEDSSFDEKVRLKHQGTVAVLTEERLTDEETAELYGADAIAVYKYQNRSDLYDAIVNGGGLVYRRAEVKTKVAALYSPIYSEPRTAFALTLAKVLGERHKTLYVNTEEFSGLDGILSEQNNGGLSDALYYYRQGTDSAYEKIAATIGKTAGLHYLSPVKCAEDMNNMNPQELMGLLDCIGTNGNMEAIVLELDNRVHISWEMLSFCDCIYMPVRDDYLSKKKLQQFESYYCSLGREDIFERVIQLNLPEGEELLSDDFWDRLAYTGMYRFVQKIAEQLEDSLFDS